MFHIVYKTTNNVNNKVYIGKHSTTNLDDGYMGSGVALKSAIKKYGKDSFTTKTLRMFDCEEDAYAYEQHILSDEYIKSSNTYNMTNKRHGSYSGGSRSEETKRRMSNAQKGRVGSNKGKTF